MLANEVEVAYARLAKAINRRSDKEQNLILSTLSLALMAEHADLSKVLSLIDKASALARAPSPREV